MSRRGTTIPPLETHGPPAVIQHVEQTKESKTPDVQIKDEKGVSVPPDKEEPSKEKPNNEEPDKGDPSGTDAEEPKTPNEGELSSPNEKRWSHFTNDRPAYAADSPGAPCYSQPKWARTRHAMRRLFSSF